MRRHMLIPLVGLILAALACNPFEQQVEEAAEEIVATSLAMTSIAQTAMAPTQTPMIITGTPEIITATPDPNATPFPTHVPAPTPVVETSTMSEEELAAAIDEAVAAALAASEEASAATTAATSDGTMTVEESVNVQVEAANAEEAITLAYALIDAYYATYGAYGEYADEALALLELTESDLSGIDEDLQVILTAMEQNEETINAVLGELMTAAEAAGYDATQAQAQAQQIYEVLQMERETRLQEVLAAAPSEVPTSRLEAIQSAANYAEIVQGSLGDGIVSQDELAAIAQAGANASAGLSAQGGPQMQGLADSINGLTTQVALGQLPQASADLGGLQSQLSSLPR